MNLELTHDETQLVLSALATEHARLLDLARRQAPYPNLAVGVMRREGAVATLRARLRDLTRRGTQAKRTRRVGARFGRQRVAQ